MFRIVLVAGFALAALVFPQSALAVTVTFDEPGLGLVHGEIVDTDFVGQGITSITTTNIGVGPDLGIIFDSDFAGATSDPDLLAPWAVGTLSGGTSNGNLLIIQENSTGCGDDVCNDPDDEAARPSGSFDILFGSAIDSFGFDLFDVDNTLVENGSIVFHDGLSTFSISWTDFELGGAFAVADLVFGDNSGNRIGPITAAGVGLTKFDRVVINMGGSGAIDNLVFTPEPTVGLLFLGGAAALWVGRRRA